MNDTLQTLIRSILKFGGGYLIAKGWADDNAVQVIVSGFTALGAVIWGVLHRTPQPEPVPITTKLPLFFALLALSASAGCSRFHSVQVEKHQDGSLTETRQSITTFFDSKTEIAKMKANTSDKTQSLTVGGFSAESSGSNAVELVDRAVTAAVTAAVHSVAPVPK